MKAVAYSTESCEKEPLNSKDHDFNLIITSHYTEPQSNRAQ